MKWLALVAMWAISAVVGLHLAQQETLVGADYALVAGWLGVALGVAYIFVRAGRRSRPPSE